MGMLRFSFGTMGSGKSTLALQIHHNLSSRDFRGYTVAMERPYTLPTSGDFDGDLQDDVFWHAATTHGNRIWSY